ncbi:hypothetical protein LCGC14_2248270, partial [marine sediment metagenome]
ECVFLTRGEIRQSDNHLPILPNRVLDPLFLPLFLRATFAYDAVNNRTLSQDQLTRASALIGLETSFRYLNNTPNLELFMYYNLAGNEFFARMDILPLSGVVRIWIDSEFVTVGNIGYNGSTNGPWLLIKLVADFVNGKYVRALIGHLELDLTAYALDSSAVASPGWVTFWLRCAAVNAVTNDGYIGHVAGTVDEP